MKGVKIELRLEMAQSRKLKSLHPKKELSPFRAEEHGARVSGAQDQPERSEANADKLIAKNEPHIVGPDASAVRLHSGQLKHN
jgi:hypothetical protein